MKEKEIETKTIRVISEVLGLEETEVDITSSFEDLGMDSLDKMEVIIALEREFNIPEPINNNDCTAIDSVASAVNMIKTYKE